jgi:hypothetical protein
MHGRGALLATAVEPDDDLDDLEEDDFDDGDEDLEIAED